ncbi:MULTISPECIES: DsbC family protein [unclassified Novosphingobium]|uniref:DsbC family protein n=1 Tax=unclassified Novosphingobium TaxID=2644732 RepID=UPI000D43ED52|nr:MULTISPECIES: DsbC family protein [unclassified Novosphingobium]PTR12596.1 thiol:disulfide interchange protein DsbC [Novosphingobium sp. GV055]PUB06380.1 thiol:disulfide interchange protein DsbC [Novosphingobium sp. GV061]PUB22431.1 thiol:disulfide interchange protein DsbC [Novosphingobium sp. GV079]PUB44456.1 thiol:disulfide interchange protein DsbC [Novosphingobium sp. GV027]
MKTATIFTVLFSGAMLLASPGFAAAQTASVQQSSADADVLSKATAEAERQLHQTFTNLTFEDFGPSPVQGPIYQANAGGRILYYAPQSEHLLFATIYDKNGINLTALAQSARAQKQLSAIDPAKALTIGPAGAPTVIEFTDPDCPYCRALDRFWAAKAAEGKQVRRLIYFVSGIHAGAASKAEHILCSPDPAAAFKAIYGGAAPAKLVICDKGRAKVEADAALVAKVGVSGTPTLIVDGKIISGFQQGELEAFLAQHAAPAIKPATAVAPSASASTPHGL